MLIRPQRQWSPIGVDIDRHSIAAAQVSRRNGDWQIECATVIPRTSDDALPSREEIQRLGDVLMRQGFRGNRVTLSIPHEALITGALDLPPTGSEESMEQLARVELARMHKCDPAALELALWELPPRHRAVPNGGSQDAKTLRHVMAAGCEVGRIQPLIDAFEGEGWDVCCLDLQSWAMVRACQPLVGSDVASTALVNIGWDAASIVLLHGNVVAYQRDLDETGLKRLRQSLMQHGELAPELATFVLLSEGLSSDGASSAAGATSGARSVLEPHIEALIREIRASCSYLSHRYADSAPRRLLLTGPGAAVPGLAARLANGLHLAVSVAAPLDLAQISSALASRQGISNNPALTTALGLALGGFGERRRCFSHASSESRSSEGAATFDLSPRGWQNAKQCRRRFRTWATAVAAYASVILLALIGSRIWSSVDNRALSTRLTSIESEMAKAQVQNASLRNELHESRAASEVNELFADQPDWSLLLGILANTMDEDLVLRSCEISARDVSRPGGSKRENTPPTAQTFELALNGLGRTQLAISQFVVGLEDLDLFDQVRLVETRREPFLSDDAVAFRIHCTLSEISNSASAAAHR